MITPSQRAQVIKLACERPFYCPMRGACESLPGPRVLGPLASIESSTRCRSSLTRYITGAARAPTLNLNPSRQPLLVCTSPLQRHIGPQLLGSQIQALIALNLNCLSPAIQRTQPPTPSCTHPARALPCIYLAHCVTAQPHSLSLFSSLYLRTSQHLHALPTICPRTTSFIVSLKTTLHFTPTYTLLSNLSHPPTPLRQVHLPPHELKKHI